ncbi:MAG: hypothetical protein QNJ09_06945 [Paracoccaceae bacterium]|nr:hypothetical protein [Paracoccaceae bacterium]
MVGNGGLRLVLGLCALVMLAGCAQPLVEEVPDDAEPEIMVEACCVAVERYPAGLVRALDDKIADKPGVADPHRLRPGYLTNLPQAHAFVRRHLRPLDLLMTSDKGLLTNRILPGYFSHSIIYLGTEDQLRAAGLWAHPALIPHHARLRAGEVFFEAVPDMVDFAGDDLIFDVDSVAVLRPTLRAGERRAVIARLMAQHGKPFDRKLDSGTDDCLYCAELVDTAMPTLRIPREQAYGRPVIAPDTIAAHALRPGTPLRFIGYLYGRPGKAVSASAAVMAANIERYWPE